MDPEPHRARGTVLRIAWITLLALSFGACAPASVTVVAGDARLPPTEARYGAKGPLAATRDAGTLRSASGCELTYEVVAPADGSGGATVVLAHGFLRDLATMRGWAEHFASHGVRTVVVSLCQATLFDGRHLGNARDLRTVADALVPPGAAVLYAGFSAGGLAALLAASGDPRTVAFLALDGVDSGGLAGTASGLTRPALFLAAEPGACNADGNLLPTVARIGGARTVRIPNATHCHFEDPSDRLCDALCGRVDPPEAAAAIRATVRSLATAWVVTHARPSAR